MTDRILSTEEVKCEGGNAFAPAQRILREKTLCKQSKDNTILLCVRIEISFSIIVPIL